MFNLQVMCCTQPDDHLDERSECIMENGRCGFHALSKRPNSYELRYDNSHHTYLYYYIDIYIIIKILNIVLLLTINDEISQVN